MLNYLNKIYKSLKFVGSKSGKSKSGKTGNKDISSSLRNRVHNHLEILAAVLLLLPIIVAIGLLSSASTIKPALAASVNGVWTEGTQFAAFPNEFNSISCAGSFCMAAGGADVVGQSYTNGIIFTSGNSGSTWVQSTIPSGIGYLNGVSCSTSNNCVAVGQAYGPGGQAVALITANAGKSWSEGSGLSSYSQLSSVSCPSNLICFATAYDSMLESYNEGFTWFQSTLPSGIGSLNSISCTSTTNCVAVGQNSTSAAGIILVTTNQGSSWSLPSIPSTVYLLNSVSCQTAACVAVGASTSPTAEILYSTNQTTWTSETVPSGFSTLSTVSCSGTATCIANLSAAHNVAVSGNGGQTWTSINTGTGYASQKGLTCFNQIDCLISSNIATTVPYGITILSTTDAGSLWGQTSLPMLSESLASVDCVTTLWCIMAGTSFPYATILITQNGGQSWTQSPTPIGFEEVFSLSCFSTSDCVASGLTNSYATEAIFTSDGGVSWTVGSLPNSSIISSVDCVSATVCIAAGYVNGASGGEILATNNGGQSWLLGTTPSGTPQLNAVSCSNVNDCVAVGGSSPGDIFITTNGGSTWSLSSQISSGTIYDVTCDSANICVLAGTGSGNTAFSDYSTDGGLTWTQSTLPSGIYLGIFSASCSGNYCYALAWGNSNSVFDSFASSDGGATWNLLSLPMGITDMFQITCPSFTFCMASSTIGSSTLVPLEFNLAPSIASISPTSGPSTGGTSVTITGSNLSNVTAVDFGSVAAASFKVNSSTSIIAVAPPVTATNTGTVNVTVTAGATVSTTSTGDQFTYLQDTYVPITPIRICDTRVNNSTNSGIINNQCNSGGTKAGTLGANSSLNVSITGTFNSSNSSASGTVTIPSNATAIVANITATNTTQNGGFLIAYPTGNTQPNTSVVNFSANDSVPNLVQIGVGTNGNITIYNFNGNADVILDLQGYFIPTSASATDGQYVPIAPIRVCDTRSVQISPSTSNNQCNSNGTKDNALGANQTLSVNVAGSGAGGTLDKIPLTATAVVLNITATNTTSNGGFLTVYPSNVTTTPNASNLNFNANDTVANRVIVPIDPSTGDITLYNFNGNTDVIVDVNGYYLGSGSSTTGSSFTPIVPTRICDTRPANPPNTASNQCDTSPNTTLTQGNTMTVNVAGSGSGGLLDNIPSNATAVVLNVTATGTSSNGGFFTIYPTPSSGSSTPNISDLNWSQGETRANMVVVEIGANDSINVYNAIGSADLIIDVMGYYQ